MYQKYTVKVYEAFMPLDLNLVKVLASWVENKHSKGDIMLWIKNYNENPEHVNLINMQGLEFEKYMVTKYPFFFRNISKGIMESCMAWGFEIPPGWRPLLDEMCEKVQVITDKYPINIDFDQIKEKFGSGRFYYTESCSDEAHDIDTYKIPLEIISDIVHMYENACYNICKDTGKWVPSKK